MRLGRRLARLAPDTAALPVDAFRVAVGLLALAWNVDLLLDVPDVSSPAGLIDHELSADVLWFTRWSLFQPGLPAWFFAAAYAAACGLSALLVLGVRPRLAAWALYLLAVSSYRWSFLVTYVDDAIVHFLLLWTALLPAGRTLNTPDLLREGRAAWARWATVRVPARAVRGLLASMALFYLVTGLWKWTSPYWRDGFALFAALKLPIAREPASWTAEQLPVLRLLTWATMALEPLLALLFVLAPGRLKSALGVAAVVMHAGILLTFRIPLANLGCLAVLILAFREEIGGRLRLRRPRRAAPMAWDGHQRLAVVLVVLVALAGLRGVPLVGDVHVPAYVGLWGLGVALEFRLFDWIDDCNVHVRYEAVFKPDGGPARPLSPDEVFPRGNRSVLVQAYLSNIVWMPVPKERRDEIKSSLYERLAARLARRCPRDGTVMVAAVRQRVTPDNLALDRGVRRTLLAFRVRGGRAEVLRADLGRHLVDNPPPRRARW